MYTLFFVTIYLNVFWDSLCSNESSIENTGLPTKDATSTAPAESSSGLVLKKFCGFQQVTDWIFIPNIFKNVYKGQIKSKDRHTYKFVWLEDF